MRVFYLVFILIILRNIQKYIHIFKNMYLFLKVNLKFETEIKLISKKYIVVQFSHCLKLKR